MNLVFNTYFKRYNMTEIYKRRFLKEVSEKQRFELSNIGISFFSWLKDLTEFLGKKEYYNEKVMKKIENDLNQINQEFKKLKIIHSKILKKSN